MKKIVIGICIIIVLVASVIWGIKYNDNKVVNNELETSGVELDINDSIVKQLEEKIDFPDYAKADIYKIGSFDTKNIPNDLVLRLGFTSMGYEEIITGYDNEGYYHKFTEELLEEGIKKVFGSQIQYKHETFNINENDCTFNNAGMWFVNTTYKDGLYKYYQVDGGGPYYIDFILETVQRAKKYDKKIELYVNTAFINVSLFDSNELHQHFAMFKNFDFINNKFIDYIGYIDCAYDNEISSYYKDRLNTYVYTFELDDDTGEYYLAGFNFFEEGSNYEEKGDVKKDFPLEYKLALSSNSIYNENGELVPERDITSKLYENGDYVISGRGYIPAGYIEYENENFYMPFMEEHKMIKRIIIEDGITGINEKAFTGLENLVEVRIPSSVEYIAKGFIDNTNKSLEKVTFYNEDESYSIENIEFFNIEDYVVEDFVLYNKSKSEIVRYLSHKINDVTFGTGEAILNNGTKVYVDFEIVEGTYYDDTVALGGRQYKNNYSGKSQFRVYTDKENKLESTVYTKDMGYQLVDRNYKIEFQDYNEDGNPDFVFEKEIESMTCSGYSVYSIFDDYTIKEMLEEGNGLSGVTHYKFLTLPKRNKGFVFETYNQSLGDYYNEFYEYDTKKEKFVYVGNDLTEEQQRYLDRE